MLPFKKSMVKLVLKDFINYIFFENLLINYIVFYITCETLKVMVTLSEN